MAKTPQAPSQTEPVLGNGAPGSVNDKPVRLPARGTPEKADKNQAPTPHAEPKLGGDAPASIDSDPTLLVLPAEITHAQAAGCLHLLLTTAGAKKRDRSPVVVDAAPLARFDSSALAVLIECRRKVLQAGRRFAMRGMSARLAELARLYGVAELLPLDTAA